MTKRFALNDLDNIQDNNPKGRLYILTERGGVNALCNLINGLNDKSNRLEKENEQLKQELNAFKPVVFQDMRKGTVILYRKGDVE